MKKVNQLTFGLFEGGFSHNLKDIPIYFKRLKFLLFHGYSPTAQWETFAWFIDVMEEILINYRFHRYGNKFWADIPEEEWAEKTNSMFDEMINYLHQMKEDDSIWESFVDIKKYNAEKREAKEKFFKLFSDYFYDLWD